MLIYFWEREGGSTSGEGAEREGDKESETGSKFRDASTELHAGLKPTNCETMTWAKVEHVRGWATQVPFITSFWSLNSCFIYFEAMLLGATEISF